MADGEGRTAAPLHRDTDACRFYFVLFVPYRTAYHRELYNVTYLCATVMTQECIQQYGPAGCWFAVTEGLTGDTGRRRCGYHARTCIMHNTVKWFKSSGTEVPAWGMDPIVQALWKPCEAAGAAVAATACMRCFDRRRQREPSCQPPKPGEHHQWGRRHRRFDRRRERKQRSAVCSGRRFSNA